MNEVMARAVTTSLVLALAMSSAMGAVNQYCSKQPFWLPDGTNVPGTDDWSSVGPTSAFVMGPCTGTSGLGTTETYLKKIIIIDRAVSHNGYLFLPGKPEDRAYAVEVDLGTLEQRPLNTITNTFCASGQNGPDGTLLSIGGDVSPDFDYTKQGSYSIRTFKPCKDGTCDFAIDQTLVNNRWYPTTALLADGRLIIVGGSNAAVGLNSEVKNVPSIEYYPKPAGADPVSHDFPFLVDTLPYNLFPFVHLLPSGKVFIFANTKYTLWDTITNAAVPGNYPEIVAADAKGAPLTFTYPIAGTSAIFPLRSTNRYLAEVMVCGGGGTTAIFFKDGAVVDDPFYPSSNKCFRIFPEAPKPVWVEEAMKLPRVMPVAVLLPDSHVVIISGTGTGHSGLGTTAHKASLTPDMYDTVTHTWYPGTLATSRIPRAYHNSAIVLHDGSIFVSGSNPNANDAAMYQGATDYPTEFRTEFFHPPYLMPGVVHPILVRAPAASTYGAKLPISFTYAKPVVKVEVVLVQPGYSTHGGNHGQRSVVLDIPLKRALGPLHALTAVVPLNRNLLPPTWYWCFVVVNGVPNVEGHYIFIR